MKRRKRKWEGRKRAARASREKTPKQQNSDWGDEQGDIIYANEKIFLSNEKAILIILA